MKDNVIIVGCGQSANLFIELLKHTDKNYITDNTSIIAVNGAVTFLPYYDYFFTLDHSLKNLEYIKPKNRLPNVEYYVAFPKDYDFKDYVGKNFYTFERYEVRGTEPIDTNSPEWWLWRWRGVLTLSKDKRCIHSGNSAYGALGLAYHLGGKNVALIGVDGSTEPRVDDNLLTNNLSHLPLLFESAMEQINVTNCGYLKSKLPTSTIYNWLSGRL